MTMIPFLKRFLLTIITFLTILAAGNAQQVKNYEKEWKKVEELIIKKLPKSALAEVKKIYALAKKEKQEAQLIKSLIYISGLQEETREDNEELVIKEMEQEIMGSTEPATSILNSLVADMYWSYYNNFKWSYLYGRSKTEKFIKEDIKTWSIDDFHKKISVLYLKSIKNERLLKETKLDNFNSIILTAGYRFLRPTLYDFLAHRALDYFTHYESEIPKPSYQFVINQEEVYGTINEFVKTRFITNDSSSLSYKAILIFQDLLKTHLNDNKKDALLDLDIRRLEFVNQYAVLENKNELYEKALLRFTTDHTNDSATAKAFSMLADIYYYKGNPGYGNENKSFDQWGLKKAREICINTIKKFPGTEGTALCSNTLRLIDEKRMGTELEQVNIPNEPFRMLFNYKNLDKVYFRLIKTTNDEVKKLYSNSSERKQYWASRLALKSYRSWFQSLPDPKDYQSHAVELKIDPLPNGIYLLLVSEKGNFTIDENLLASDIFWVSNISFTGNKDFGFFILNRNTGKPLTDVTVKTWINKYDYSKSKYAETSGKTYTPDQNGKINLTEENGQIKFEIKGQSDYLFLDDYFFIQKNPGEPDNKKVLKGFLFADRSIYRPGQLLFFKGIAAEYDQESKEHRVLVNHKSKIVLKDPNGQVVEQTEVITNEYGSYKGSFHIPEGRLNGNYFLWDSLLNAYQYLNVEEYKRPKFYVEIKKPEGSYRLNDSITVKGYAKAYAGNNIDGANVKFRVVRYKYRPWWRENYIRSYPYNQEQKEIVFGETTTDLNGEFTLKFKAISDAGNDKKDQPYFDFEINADVTDINGETRSDKANVVIAYQAIKLEAQIQDRIHADSLKQIEITTKNMNDIFEPVRVNISIYALKKPGRIFRPRLWNKPDQFIMSREQYYSYFPYDIYNDEDIDTTWEKIQKVLEDTFTTGENKKYQIKDHSFSPGWYSIEINTKDKYGEPVTFKKTIRLFTEKDFQKLMAGANIEIIKGNAEPGEKLKYQVNTPLNDVWLIRAVKRINNKNQLVFEAISNESRTYEFTATEEDRGGIGISFMFIKYNRMYTGNETLSVPWSNKELKISYETFRDKITPGSNETWKIKVSGNKADKIAAEALVSMYDASLDQFKFHKWASPDIYPLFNELTSWESDHNFSKTTTFESRYTTPDAEEFKKIYDHFVFGNSQIENIPYLLVRNVVWDFGEGDISNPRLMRLPKPVFQHDLNPDTRWSLGRDEEKVSALTLQADMATYRGNKYIPPQENTDTVANIQPRRNFNETAFFFPDLRTNENGDIEFSFTIPEALTKWKFQALAHTKDLAFGYSSKEIVTQKDLMVQPNPPRFLREGDKIEFSAKIVNLTDKEITGQTQLQLFDATTNEAIDGRFRSSIPNQYFTVAAGQSEAVKFPLEVPYQFNKALVWRIVANAGDKSDGEENALPVLTNRMLVTESMPVNMKGTGTKDFKFEKLLNAGQSSTLQHHALTVEYTANPAWYAVQALPYLMEYPYECAEQTWNRYYANVLAGMIANSSSRIKQIFESWKTKDTAALLSNLQKNQELKAVLLEETPWVLQAKNEEQQKRNIALLFDLARMSNELNSTYEKLKQMQSPNGGFVWFQGGPDNAYITQYILTGIGHLKKLGVDIKKLSPILEAALPYLDLQIKKDYDDLKKSKTDLNKYTPGNNEIQYLYMRSFFPETKVTAASKVAYDYFRSRVQKTWTKQSKYMQGMIALALYRTNDAVTPPAILRSLKETSILNEELGMYWKEFTNGGYYWHQAPVESQALLIEVFSEVAKDQKTVDDLKTWLLKNKQTNNWKTTKATAEACYALLLQGTKLLNAETTVEIKLGTTTLSSNDNKTESGTGYLKKAIDGPKVNPQMGNISVTIQQTNNQTASSWGSVYWQYFEDLDKITSAETPLKLSKKLFIEKNTDRGPVLIPINDGDFLKVGDKIKVRIELRADRDMEYVHMKDMRASCMEPVNVLSSYKWQGGLGYYETTKDASTNFFFDYVRKGTYVFEYPLFVTHQGNFSNGITTIQCMYAPEFTSHSEGVRVNVE
jgi:uncharacterized protein YfaS (alpha-2-macroglobulin family)